MDQVLQLVGHQHHCPLVVLEELQNALLHEVVTQVDVQGGEGVVLGTERHADPLTAACHRPRKQVALNYIYRADALTHSGEHRCLWYFW